MGKALRDRIKQYQFESPIQEALLNLLVAADSIKYESERVCARFGITPPLYNVLRILRGVYPEGHPRCEIAERMLERAPDVTRLIDRLEHLGLAERNRTGEDKRMSISRITAAGLNLLEEMKSEMEQAHKGISERLSEEECLELSTLLEKLYARG